MKSKKIIVLIVAIVSLCIVFVSGTVFIVGSYVQKVYENPLANIPQEVEKAPNYVVYGTLYSEYGKLSISSICREQNENFELEEVLCVKDGKAYFVYSAPYGESNCWETASIDLNTLEFRTHCKLVEPVEFYEYGDFDNDYKQQNGYYFDDQIILTDHENVLVYDLEKQCSKTYAYTEYVFPQKQIYGEMIDNGTIKLNIGEFSRIYTLQEMAEKSDSIAQIFALKEKSTWSGNSYLYRFFSQFSIQVARNKIYAVCECLNSKGYAYVVILEYSELSDSWMYVTNARSAAGDIVHGRCYVVP